jgi:peptidoglycan/xylan/chitin deacetylase (PgdA/CDA1 family)
MRCALLISLVLLLAVVSLASSRPQVRPQRVVALTFDDLPKTLDSGNVAETKQTTTTLLDTLKRHRAPAIGFVNEWQLHIPGQIDARVAILKQWVDAGMILGNHTFSHPDLQTTPLLRYQDDVIHGEVITRRLMMKREYQLYFRHPFTHTGPTLGVKAAFEEFLRIRGYKVAPFTIENSDYIFNKLYVDARKANDQALMQRIRKAYLDYNDGAFIFMEGLSRETFKREIPQILLIHSNDLHADCLDEMLRRLETRGYTFITLDKALSDPAYLTRDSYIGSNGPSWLHRWRFSLGLPSRMPAEPDPPKWVLDMFNNARRPQPR